MIRFAQLYAAMDTTTKTNEKIAAIATYFSQVDESDAAWATYFLAGNKLRQLVPSKMLRRWAAETAGIPDWLFDESYQAVGDLAETISLIVPAGQSSQTYSLADWIEKRLMPLPRMELELQRQQILSIWNETSFEMRFLTMKLITGSLRVGVGRGLLIKGLAKQFQLTPELIAERLMGKWEPRADFFSRVVSQQDSESVEGRPYPFCLAHPLDPELGPQSLGAVVDYIAEWKWDGIRGQVIKRKDRVYLWSRGEDLMENRWPEIEAAASQLPNGTVLDGEILAVKPNGEVLPFAQLQRRIGRKSIGKKLLTEVPVTFQAFDLLERNGIDIRSSPLEERRAQLELLLSNLDRSTFQITQWHTVHSWDQLSSLRQSSREVNAEGLMLKHRASLYDVGRVRGTWWKWKVTPYTIDAVLIYAQKGHGRRADLFTDYTFALWDQGVLVPFAKAYSGLDDSELRLVDRFVRQNTKETFGPVRSVKPELVMELAFEGLQRSTRHKSGIATRFPRIIRWRHDKKPEDANSLDELLELLPP